MCADFLDLRKTIEVLNNEKYDFIHLDVMDGSFYPDYLLGNKLIEDIKSLSNCYREYHLMIRNPERYIDLLQVVPNDRIIIHYELCESIPFILEKVRKKGCEVGMAIDAKTPAAALDPYYRKLDLVLIMLIHSGRMGSEFQPHCLEKIKYIRREIQAHNPTVLIGVDGSVNKTIIPPLKKLGVNVFVGGSSGLFMKDLPFSRCAREFKNLVLV